MDRLDFSPRRGNAKRKALHCAGKDVNGKRLKGSLIDGLRFTPQTAVFQIDRLLTWCDLHQVTRIDVRQAQPEVIHRLPDLVRLMPSLRIFLLGGHPFSTELVGALSESGCQLKTLDLQYHGSMPRPNLTELVGALSQPHCQLETLDHKYHGSMPRPNLDALGETRVWLKGQTRLTTLKMRGRSWLSSIRWLIDSDCATRLTHLSLPHQIPVDDIRDLLPRLTHLQRLTLDQAHPTVVEALVELPTNRLPRLSIANRTSLSEECEWQLRQVYDQTN